MSTKNYLDIQIISVSKRLFGSRLLPLFWTCCMMGLLLYWTNIHLKWLIILVNLLLNAHVGFVFSNTLPMYDCTLSLMDSCCWHSPRLPQFFLLCFGLGLQCQTFNDIIDLALIRVYLSAIVFLFCSILFFHYCGCLLSLDLGLGCQAFVNNVELVLIWAITGSLVLILGSKPIWAIGHFWSLVLFVRKC